MVAVLEKLHDTQAWKDALVKNGWSDAFLTGPAFENFLTEQDHRVETTLTELGLV
jgi:putative tricarboxylic transport membrane protein